MDIARHPDERKNLPHPKESQLYQDNRLARWRLNIYPISSNNT
ncbi:hypothetical protein CSC32_0047 [Pseudomonas aeruginosa]|nr:hypothetical protein CSC32_0047 [Pseudomonas aeruginosa]